MKQLNYHGCSARKILIVDDAPLNLRRLAKLLEQQGYIVHWAHDGATAGQAAQSYLPDLIMLDIMMPEIDGYETCRQLTANLATATIPVIFVSALDAAAESEQAFAAGVVDYISKLSALGDRQSGSARALCLFAEKGCSGMVRLLPVLVILSALNSIKTIAGSLQIAQQSYFLPVIQL